MVAVVLSSAVIAACLAPHLGTTSQDMISLSMGSDVTDFGLVDVGNTVSTMFTFSPATTLDDDTIMSVTAPGAGCTDYSLIGAGTPFRVYYPCMGSGSAGSGCAVFAPVGSGACTPTVFNFSVSFMPKTVGEADCNVLVTSAPTLGGSASTYTLMLKGSGMQTVGLSVSPTTMAFGGVPIGGASSASTLTVTNTGTVALSMTGVNTDATTFQVSPAITAHSLAAGNSDIYSVTCHPLVATGYVADISFQGTAGTGSAGGSTHVTCTGITSFLNISPSPVTFPTTLVGASPADQTVSIMNNGSDSTLSKVQLDATAVSNGVTLVGPSILGTINLGQTKSVNLHYLPTTMHPSGPLGNLVVRVASDSSDRDVALNGEALDGSLATNPASVEFGPVCLGGSGATRDIKMYAPAPGDIKVMSVTQPTNVIFGVTPTTFGGGLAIMGRHVEEKILTTTAKPTVAGDFMDTFTLHTNIPNQATLDVSMHVTALPSGIGPSPSQVHFGAVASTMTSPGKEVVVTNCGSTAIDITGAHFDGSTPSEFAIVLPTDPHKTLQPLDSESFTIIMAPRTGGPKSANLVIEYAGGPVSVPVDGTGFDPTGTGNDTPRETYYACSTGRPAAWWPIAFALLALRRRRSKA